MDAKREQLNRLAKQEKWKDIIALVEQIPETERDLDVIGTYVRALNNDEQLQRAVDVSLQYAELGNNSALWHYRLGYSYVHLSRYDEAEKVLLRGKELAQGDAEVTGWIDDLLEDVLNKKNNPAYADIKVVNEEKYKYKDFLWVHTSQFAERKFPDKVTVVFDNSSDEITALGEKMMEINENAYMNGYNWEAFFNYYLSKYAPDAAVNMDTDPEAGSYVAYYPLTPENVERAVRFGEIIRSLVENEAELLRIVRDEGDTIEWD